MRILIHGLNFAPELVGVGKYTGEMAEWLAARGHEVRAVTAPPFNPKWKVAPGFSPWRYSRESYSCLREAHRQEFAVAAAAGSHGGAEVLARNSRQGLLAEPVYQADLPRVSRASARGGLTVFRCPVWVPRQPSAAKRIMHVTSFAMASFLVMLGQIVWKPDIVMVIEPTLLCLPAAWLAGRLCRARTWLHVQDFEADAGFELGLLRSAALKRMVGWMEKKSMSAFDRVSTISGKMLMRLSQKGVAPSACLLFPNWVDTGAIFPLRKASLFRNQLGIAADEIVALYAGTMARKQGLEVLAEAAGRLGARPGLRFVFCGEGPGRAILADRTSQMRHVHWIPMQPLERLNDLLNLADIHLLPQKADAADLVMPSKLTGMLASGRPVIATCRPDTQLAQTVEGRGIVVAPGDAAAFAGAIERLAEDRALRERLGNNARNYAISALEKEGVLSDFDQALLALVAG